MFTVKCDGQWLYNPQLNYQLINPKLTLADCAAGSFEFTMDKTHPLYDKVYEITSRVYVYRNGALIWEGRPIKEKDDWYGNRSVTCEGALAYLNDTIQEQAEYHDNSVRTWLTTLINKHNAKVDASRQFKIGTITVEDNLYRYTNYETTLEAINDKLLSRLGGHLRVRRSGNYNYIDYLKDYPYASTQKIEFGRNLLDFSKSYNLENIVTAILPLGARLEDSAIEALEAYTDISSVNTDGTWHTKNTPYIQNKAAVDSFGWICKVVRWDDVTEPANLYTKAKKYLTEFQYNDLDLEIKAIDFNFVDSQIEALNILDQVQVISKPHGLDKLFPISKMEIVLNNISNTTLTLGAHGYLDDTSMTSKNNSALSSLLKKIEEIPTESHLLDEAKAIATELITSGALGSYVIVLPEEIIVTNNLNYTARTAHVWRWNKNGLGYSSTGYNGTFGLAMTADGAIVADRITTGTMSANRIKGGILTLGGKDNGNGVLHVYDAVGELIAKLDRTGLAASGELTLRGTYENLPFLTQLGSIRYRPLNSSTYETLYGMLVKYGENQKIVTPRSQIEIIKNSINPASLTEAERMILLLDANPNNAFTEKITPNQYDAYFLESYSSTGAYYRARLTYNNDRFYWRGNSGGIGGAKPCIDVSASLINIGQSSRTTPNITVYSAGKINVGTAISFESSDGQTTFMINQQGVHYNGLRVHSSSSSKRYKHDITDKIDSKLDAHKLYDLPMKQFVFNDDAPVQYHGMKGKTLPGFIAEEVAKIYPAATIYDANGVVESWDERRIIPGMLKLIQEQHDEISELKTRLATLEAVVE